MSPRAAAATSKPAKKAKKPARRKADPVKQWTNYLRRYRPGLQGYVLEQLTATYGEQVWEPRLDPTSELILTILTQNTADTNAEKAYEALRRAYPSDRKGRRPPRSRSASSARRQRTATCRSSARTRLSCVGRG